VALDVVPPSVVMKVVIATAVVINTDVVCLDVLK
jgi:hypothetical protein